MPRLKGYGLFGEVAIRAMSDALYERLLDRCWEDIKKVFNRPDVRQAEGVIMRAIADAFSPNDGSARRRRK